MHSPIKVTVILKNLSEAFYYGSPFTGPGLLQQTDAEKFDRLEKLRANRMATMKVGTGQFRDLVELNTRRRAGAVPVSFTLEPRKGYKLATFIF